MRTMSAAKSRQLVKKLTRKWEYKLDRSSPRIEFARFTPQSAEGAARSITFADDRCVEQARSIIGVWTIAAPEFPGVGLALFRATGPSRMPPFAWLDDELNAIQLDFSFGDRALGYAEASEAFEGWMCELLPDDIRAQFARLGQRREIAEDELELVRKISAEYRLHTPDAGDATLGPGLDHSRVVIETDLRNIDAMLSIYKQVKEELGIS